MKFTNWVNLFSENEKNTPKIVIIMDIFTIFENKNN